MIQALENLGAFKTAELFNKFISYIPKGTVLDSDSFFDYFTNNYEYEYKKIENAISEYPDGLMMPLYIDYALKPENSTHLFEEL